MGPKTLKECSLPLVRFIDDKGEEEENKRFASGSLMDEDGSRGAVVDFSFVEDIGILQLSLIKRLRMKNTFFFAVKKKELNKRILEDPGRIQGIHELIGQIYVFFCMIMKESGFIIDGWFRGYRGLDQID